MAEAHYTDTQETKREVTGISISLLIHAALLLLCYFIFVWKEPDPPLPVYGIEINFGSSEMGSGNVQTLEPPGTDKQTPSKVEETKPIEAPKQEAAQPAEPEPVNELESPLVVPKKTENQSKPAEKPVEKTETKESKTQATPSPVPVYNPNAGSGSTNEGNKPGTVGDQGRPDGEIDKKGLYGAKGSGGSSLDLAGWDWENKPVVNDQSTEEGKIVFKISVDESGELVSVRVIEKTVSPALVKLYQAEVERLTFVKKRGNVEPPPISEGKITFIIRSR
jgi:outer membrane biosynthesis protein TonB